MQAKKALSLFVVATILLTILIYPISANATEYFVIHGQGCGHGVGMCLSGAKGMAEAGYTYRNILRKYYTSAIPSSTQETQLIRVGLYSTTLATTISGNGDFEVFDDLENKLWAGTDGQSITISYDIENSSYLITTPTETIEVISSHITVSPTASSILSLENFSPPNHFRGNMEVRFSSNSNLLWAINELSLNEYLYGLAEASDSWPKNALKALAVAARTYALEKKLNASTPYKADGFDLSATTDCQYYLGYDYEVQAPNFKQAIDETTGEILVYNSNPISAVYHSCCGGHTENNENIWGGSALPYLRGVPCGYCTWSSNYNWNLSISADELQTKLNSNPTTSVLGNLEGFEILQAGITPRVKTLRILGSGGSNDVSGTDFGNVLKLKSAWFNFRPITRMSGENRYQTAIDVSKQGWNSAETIILTKGTDFPDALSGTPLAYKNNAPILLTDPTTINQETMDEINRLNPDKVIILGGKGAISETIESQLLSEGINSERIGGKDRYETAAKIALEVGSPGKTAIIATGSNYPDALSISSYAAYNQIPILLVNKDYIPDSTTDALNDLNIEQTIIVGGTGVISSEVQANLRNPIRMGGADRYDTAKKIAERYFAPFPGASSIFVVTGENFPDALASAPYAAKIGPCPILLTRSDIVPAPTRNYLIGYTDYVKRLYIVGGFGAISEKVQNELGSL